MTANTDAIFDFANANTWITNLHGLGFKHKVTTWEKDTTLDAVYEHYRQLHYSKTDLKLRANYSQYHVSEVSAKSIYWGHDGLPKIICSILSRPCWPPNVYRILNRLWKVNINTGGVKSIDPGFAMLVEDQMKYCKNLGAHGVFMSRSIHGNWFKWAGDYFKKELDLDFFHPSELYLTCENEFDYNCWQQILFFGTTGCLNQWKKQ
jgi:hypothetical protein